ncbi:putative membrane-bound dehydrogenase domain-containing protein [Fodinibius roseus]|uniref:Putative membrane-bound dehydrogenase domain-containing protein n=2 Tax=Fodinibius roseus TaxID=1194090 RepID=A0A1M4TTT6_9BACT|nr:putative membrane-bound dehydrogenase domain-containing protein [Fodinibius roseus]
MRWVRFALGILMINWAVLLTGCEKKQVTQIEGLQVPEGFTIERVVSSDLISYPMFATFDSQGRLFVFESTETNTMGTDTMLENPSYQIRLLEDTDGDGVFDKSTIFADQIPFPMGGEFYNGSLYVTASPDLLKLTDTNGDGAADERETLLSGWTLNSNGAILSGPFMGPDGWLYMAGARRGYAIKTQDGDSLTGEGARIWRTKPDGTDLEWVSAGGFDNSIEIAFMPSGETIGTMTYFTDPQNGQRDALMHWVEGGVYPKYHSVIEQDQLELSGDLMPVMSKFPRIAPSGLMRYKGLAWGQAYQGNLFSAIFNTGEVLRHSISRNGATYSTEDEPFVTATREDIHPTDVLEDADGSLLVVVTGGWFIEGCPLSRESKPNVEGGIYRIRKAKGNQHVNDPWGQAVNFSEMPARDLTEFFADSRPKVREKALEAVVQQGGRAVAALQNLLSSPKEKVRTAAVFALYRIGTAEANDAARSALTDESDQVRTAAARVAGLAKDMGAIEKLEELVQADESPAVQRQAATALGQIGDPIAVDALLRAADGVSDRFLEHAIIHSLVTLGDSDPLVEALTSTSNQVRKAALTALDQMDSSSLTKDQLLPFLSSEKKELREVGVWVASHHPEWSEIVVDFLDSVMGTAELTDEEAVSYGTLMNTFCGNDDMQRFLGNGLSAQNTPPGTKLIFIDVMSRCDIPELPDLWVDQLGKELRAGSDQVRYAVLNLIGSRQVEALNQQLKEIIHNPEEINEFRLEAMKARVSIQPQITWEEFEIVTDYLSEANRSPVRQSAARILSQAELNEQQLLHIARTQLPRADPFMVPGLIETFQDSKSEKVGLALVKVLKNSPENLDNVPQQDLKKIINAYPESVQAAAASLMKEIQKKQSERLAKLQKLEKQLGKGDVGAGRKLFFGKATCSTCHTVGSEGTEFGPDLTNIGAIRSRHDILEALVFPSASFAREYETYQVTTSSNSYSGVIVEQLSEALILSVGPGQKIRITRDEISSIDTQNMSLMPPGLDQQLTKAELSNLMAFLEALPDQLTNLEE